jgi:hypothetical protein
MRELRKRWNSDTPMFFKKVINFGIIVGIVGSGLITLPVTAAVGAVMITIGATAATISKLTKI